MPSVNFLTRNDSCCRAATVKDRGMCKIFVAKGVIEKNKVLGTNLPAIVVKHGTDVYFATEVSPKGPLVIRQREVQPSAGLTREQQALPLAARQELLSDQDGPLVWIETSWPVDMKHSFDASKT